MKTPEALNLRSLCLFLTIALKKWEENPAATEANMSKRCICAPHKIRTECTNNSAQYNSKPWSASWDKDPKVAKIEKIICTYFNSGIGDKVRTFMHLMERNPAEYKIKEGSDLPVFIPSASHIPRNRVWWCVRRELNLRGNQQNRRRLLQGMSRCFAR